MYVLSLWNCRTMASLKLAESSFLYAIVLGTFKFFSSDMLPAVLCRAVSAVSWSQCFASPLSSSGGPRALAMVSVQILLRGVVLWGFAAKLWGAWGVRETYENLLKKNTNFDLFSSPRPVFKYFWRQVYIILRFTGGRNWILWWWFRRSYCPVCHWWHRSSLRATGNCAGRNWQVWK